MVTAIIPARFASSRFPGKPLARSTGKFLIEHVCERVSAADRIDRCIVATDDERIREAVASFGGDVMMTRADHPCGTNRIAEVAGRLDLPGRAIVLNVQGDEPELDPRALDRLVGRLADAPECPCATLACPFPAEADPDDPNAVKVVCDQAGRALYFSRSRIPSGGDPPGAGDSGPLLHIGVYAYQRDFLLAYAGWSPTPLERSERLEQLRVLEHGHTILVERVERSFPGVDTPEDYEQFVARWRNGGVAGESEQHDPQRRGNERR